MTSSGILTAREIRAIADRLVATVQPNRVILFGSYAKGLATTRSDVDILLVVPDLMAGRYRPTELAPYVAGSAVRVDLHIVTASELEVYSREPHHFLHSISISGRTLHPIHGEVE